MGPGAVLARITRLGVWLACCAAAGGCNNNPWPEGDAATNTLYTAVSGASPRHLDPTASYWSNETPYTYQIYEPPYGYHYLKRPFVLQGKTAVAVAPPRYLDAQGQPLPADAPAADIAESVYDVRIKSGIRYQPHPAFATDAQGRYRYHSDQPLAPGELADRRSPWAYRAPGHPRTGRRRLRLRDQAARDHPHHHADLGHLLGVRAGPEGLRRDDQARGRGPAPGARPGGARQALSRLPALAAGGRHRPREAPAAHPHPRQVPAMELLDGDDLPGTGALGGRRFLCAAGHGGQRAVARSVASGHRPVHDGRVGAGPPPRDAPQPQLPRRHLPLRGRRRRPRGRPAGRLRQAAAVRRHAGVGDRERGRPAARQVPPGLLRRAAHRAHRRWAGVPGRDGRFRGGAARVLRAWFPTAQVRRRQLVVSRLQHARPGDRSGRHPRAADPQPQAAPGALDRDRLGGVQPHLPEERGRNRDGPAARRHLRFAATANRPG